MHTTNITEATGKNKFSFNQLSKLKLNRIFPAFMNHESADYI